MRRMVDSDEYLALTHLCLPFICSHLHLLPSQRSAHNVMRDIKVITSTYMYIYERYRDMICITRDACQGRREGEERKKPRRENGTILN